MFSASLPDGRRGARLNLSPTQAVWISLAIIVAWAVWAAAFNTAQFGDNIEQFNWAQSLELGYHKHPPLPSWVLGTVVRVFGPSIYWAYLLATLCLLGTATFTWLIGRRLLSDHAAAAAVVLWGLSLTFSQRAQLYNHNTVLILCIAATVWFAMRATVATRWRHVWWAATGFAAAAAILSKYQALVPLGGLLAALVVSGSFRERDNRRGVCFTIALTVLLCAPHALWVAKHDFCTLRYASDSVEPSTLFQRLGFIVSFTANQLRINSLSLLAVAICVGLGRWWQPAHKADIGSAADPAIGRWMFGLLGSGLIALAVMAVAGGVGLRNHWGVQALQFLPIWLVWRWEQRAPIDLGKLVCAALIIHAVSLAVYAAEHRDPQGVLSSRRIDTMYPARRLAQAAVAHWTESTSCAMHYVAGTAFDSGLVSLYSGGNLEVFDNVPATPWVRLEDMQREGALYLLDGDDPVPAGVDHVVPFELVPGGRVGQAPRMIRIGILMPRMPCDR